MLKRARLDGLVVLATAIGLVMPAAAVGAVRYAESGVGGANPACPQADPCDIEEAVESAVAGDEIVILTGTYSMSGPLSINGSGTVVHGEAGQPRPVLQTTSFNGVVIGNTNATLRNFAIEHSGSASGTALNGFGTWEGVLARSATGYACRISLTATVRDSACSTAGGTKPAIDVIMATFTNTVRLRNITAVSAGSFGLNARAVTGQDLTVDAKSVIARGGAGVDVRAETDSAASTTSTIILDHSNYATAATLGTGTSVTAAGTGTNQTAAPLFVDVAAGDFHQLAGSPTVDAGAVDPFSGATDFDGQARTIGAAADIGADEFQPPAPPPPPSNEFQIGKLKGKRLSLTVPGPGEIDLIDAATAKRRLKPSGATAAGAGEVTVRLRLTSSAQKKLKRRGRLRVRAAITFTPTGGDANTQTVKRKVKR